MSFYSSFPEDKKNLEFFRSQNQQQSSRFQDAPPSYQASNVASSSSSSQSFHQKPPAGHFQSAGPAMFVGPQAIPSPVSLMTHFVKLGRGACSLGWGEKLYSLSLAPVDAPNHIIYQYMPDVGKDSSSGSHRATLSAFGQPIFHVHVSGEYTFTPNEGEIIGVPSGPHFAFREAGKYKPFKKEEGVDKYNPVCHVLPGQNTDIQVARYCARVLSSLLNANALTGSKAIKPNKIAPNGSYGSTPTPTPTPNAGPIDPTPTNFTSTSSKPVQDFSSYGAEMYASSSTSEKPSGEDGKKLGFLEKLKEGLKNDGMEGLSEEEKKQKKKKQKKQEMYGEMMGAVIGS